MYIIGCCHPPPTEDEDSFVLSESAMREMIPQMPGLPLCYEHDTNIRVGTIRRAWRDEKDDCMMISASIDETTPDGARVSKMVKEGKLLGLSMGIISVMNKRDFFRITTRIPVEVSVVAVGALADTYIRKVIPFSPADLRTIEMIEKGINVAKLLKELEREKKARRVMSSEISQTSAVEGELAQAASAMGSAVSAVAEQQASGDARLSAAVGLPIAQADEVAAKVAEERSAAIAKASAASSDAKKKVDAALAELIALYRSVQQEPNPTLVNALGAATDENADDLTPLAEFVTVATAAKNVARDSAFSEAEQHRKQYQESIKALERKHAAEREVLLKQINEEKERNRQLAEKQQRAERFTGMLHKYKHTPAETVPVKTVASGRKTHISEPEVRKEKEDPFAILGTLGNPARSTGPLPGIPLDVMDEDAPAAAASFGAVASDSLVGFSTAASGTRGGKIVAPEPEIRDERGGVKDIASLLRSCGHVSPVIQHHPGFLNQLASIFIDPSK